MAITEWGVGPEHGHGGLVGFEAERDVQRIERAGRFVFGEAEGELPGMTEQRHVGHTGATSTTLIIANRIAWTEAFARWPGPRAPKLPEIGPHEWAAGPLTMMSGAD
ncbi:MAG: hypothetical protein R2710_14630 [Acidimicrobiales bacterium]